MGWHGASKGRFGSYHEEWEKKSTVYIQIFFLLSVRAGEERGVASYCLWLFLSVYIGRPEKNRQNGRNFSLVVKHDWNERTDGIGFHFGLFYLFLL
jgi:hypothetical protein